MRCRGVFRRVDAPFASYPDLLAVAYRAPRAIMCCVSAAAVNLTDELPAAVQALKQTLEADPPQALLLLDAEIRAQSVRGERWIPASEFFVSFLQSALEEDEIATAIRFKSQPGGAETYIKHRRRMMDLAIVGIGDQDWDTSRFREHVDEALDAHADARAVRMKAQLAGLRQRGCAGDALPVHDESRVPRAAERARVAEVGAVIGAHVGPGLLGVGSVSKSVLE